MTEVEWDQSNDWVAMLRAIPNVNGTRELRLWCVAWARTILAVADRHEPFMTTGIAAWFTPSAVTAYARGLDAAEAFADGVLSRRELIAAKAPVGGPWNVFHLPTGLSRLTAQNLLGTLTHFTGEFRVPAPTILASLLRDIFGNPFRPVAFSPSWRTDTALTLARMMYDSRDFGGMPILADALQDAGCEDEQILNHCRGANQVHVRGCWVVDLVLGKE